MKRASIRLGPAVLLAAVIVLVSSNLVSAAAGNLDTSFSGDGKLTTAFESDDVGYSVVVRPDGKIIAVGLTVGYTANVEHHRFALSRYNPDGTLDTTFSGDGKQTTIIGSYAEAHGIALQPDGKIVVAGGGTDLGLGTFAVVRYRPDGTLDPTFSGDGRATTPVGWTGAHASAVAIEPDGKIVAAGTALIAGRERFAVVRYKPNGTLDTTFSGDGKAIALIGSSCDASAVAIQRDGRIVVGGITWVNLRAELALARFNPDGTLDTTFSGDGKVVTLIGKAEDEFAGLAIQPDGKVVVDAVAYDSGVLFDFGLARYNPNGTLDDSFSHNGKLTTRIGKDAHSLGIAIDQQGRVVASGYALFGVWDRFALARYKQDGTLDPTFGEDGVASAAVGHGGTGRGVAIQRDGRIVVVGSTLVAGHERFAVARFLGS